MELRGYEKNAINIYPNPAEDVLYIELPFLQEDVRFQMSDVRGRVVDDWIYSGVSRVEIPVGDIPEGVYFLRISGPGINDVKKIFVE